MKRVSQARKKLEMLASEVQKVVRRNLAVRSLGTRIDIGADGTPTELIDKLAENAVISALKKENLELNILSEECGFIDRGYEKTLVLDPIDGTKNLVRGLPAYCISLAIGTKALSDVEYGLVKNLATGDTYFAERGGGAFLNGKRMKVSRFNPREPVFLVYMGEGASYSTAFEVIKKCIRVRNFGAAALEMCFVASGAADMYHIVCRRDAKRLRITDIAASTLIVREAGGEVLDERFRPIEMEFDLKARTNLIAIGDKILLRKIL